MTRVGIRTPGNACPQCLKKYKVLDGGVLDLLCPSCDPVFGKQFCQVCVRDSFIIDKFGYAALSRPIPAARYWVPGPEGGYFCEEHYFWQGSWA